jgi:hypothetical protein
MSAIAEPAGYRRKTTVDRRCWVRVVELLAYGVHLETCPMAARGERAKATKGTRVLCTCGLDLAIDGATLITADRGAK